MFENFTTREKEILDNSIKIFNKYLDSSRIYIFGSRAKGISYKNSDFDFALDSEKPEAKIERKMKEEIEEIAGLYSIDIVYLKNIDDGFKNIVLNSGIVVYER
jgi:uncharacterized protein